MYVYQAVLTAVNPSYDCRTIKVDDIESSQKHEARKIAQNKKSLHLQLKKRKLELNWMHLTCDDLIVTTTRDRVNLLRSFRTISNKKPSLMSQTFTIPSSSPMTKKAAIRSRRLIYPSDTRKFWRVNRGKSEITRISEKLRNQKFFRWNRPDKDLRIKESWLFQVWFWKRISVFNICLISISGQFVMEFLDIKRSQHD